MQKQVQIRVRLSAATAGQAVQCALTHEEYSALKILAVALGYGERGISTLIRRLAELAAGPSEGYNDVHSLLTSAAAKAGVSLGAFMRLCVLEAIGRTQLKNQLFTLAEGVVSGRARA